MKKAILGILLVTLLTCGCNTGKSNSADTNTKTEKKAEQTTETKAEKAAWNDTYLLDDSDRVTFKFFDDGTVLITDMEEQYQIDTKKKEFLILSDDRKEVNAQYKIKESEDGIVKMTLDMGDEEMDADDLAMKLSFLEGEDGIKEKKETFDGTYRHPDYDFVKYQFTKDGTFRAIEEQNYEIKGDTLRIFGTGKDSKGTAYQYVRDEKAGTLQLKVNDMELDFHKSEK